MPPGKDAGETEALNTQRLDAAEQSLKTVRTARFFKRGIVYLSELDGLTQQGLTEIRIAQRPRSDGFFEVVREGHYSVSCFFRRL